LLTVSSDAERRMGVSAGVRESWGVIPQKGVIGIQIFPAGKREKTGTA
jgi:hypothetical protein